MQSHTGTPEAIAQELGTSLDQGLSSKSADERLAQYGPNRLAEAKRRNIFLRFLDQLKDVMIIILLIAAAVSFITALVEGEPSAYAEPVLILVIVVLNAVLGLAQENRAEQALEALQAMSAPQARVIRGGEEQQIDAESLVPGDIILLEAGDYVPADARLISSAALKVEESALTGESVPAEKEHTAEVQDKAALGDRVNMVYSGCSVSYGRAKAVVTSTGMDTEMGKIAGLLSAQPNTQTPLQNRLAHMSRYLGVAALIACAAVFVIGLIDGLPIMEMFMVAVSLAVSSIPEGLPATITIILAIGVQRMVKRGAIIRRLPAVETLGSASVICSDKTGTLTQNRMTVTRIYTKGSATIDFEPGISEAAESLIKLAALCCDGTIRFENGKEQHIGDPTETAIVKAAHILGMERDALNKKYPRLIELPFDSERKRMTVVCDIDGKYLSITKGAFDGLRSRCISGELERGARETDEMARSALRVLAVAFKELDRLPENPHIDDLESDLHFLGLIGMIDPPRPEAREAVAECRRAGIRPVMITGDHVVTASAIARDLGILKEDNGAVDGSALADISNDELAERVEHISVYARVSPQDKIRIVQAWQSKGQIVAMTGDGVNDAPALRAADIGCAMGITGTDVAKGAADMVLTDDNFATIVTAVREGRGIYANIRKVVGFLLGTNIGELFSVFFAMLIWRESPLLSMQLLWINLITDSAPAIALGMEPVENSVMEEPPRDKDEGILAGGLGFRVIWQGLMFSVLTLIGFHIGLSWGGITAGRTMAFFVLATCQIVQSFNMRSDRSLLKIPPFSNKYLNGAALISLALLAMVLFVPPIQGVFGLTALPFYLYLAAIGLALIPIPVMEIAKALLKTA